MMQKQIFLEFPCFLRMSYTFVYNSGSIFSLFRPEYTPLFSLLHRILGDFLWCQRENERGSICADTVGPHHIPASPGIWWHTSALCLWASHGGTTPKAQVEQGDHATSSSEGHVLSNQTIIPTDFLSEVLPIPADMTGEEPALAWTTPLSLERTSS